MHSGNKSSDMPACFRTTKRNVWTADKTSVGRRRKNAIHCTEYCNQCAHRNSNAESNYAKVRHTSTCITQPSRRGRRQTVRLSRSSGRRAELHPNICSHKFLTVTLFGNGKILRSDIRRYTLHFDVRFPLYQVIVSGRSLQSWVCVFVERRFRRFTRPSPHSLLSSWPWVFPFVNFWSNIIR